MAPRIGVIRPMRAYMHSTKQMLKKNNGKISFLILPEYTMHKTPKIRIKMFSNADISTNGDEESVGNGRRKTLAIAPGAWMIKLPGVGSITGISITLFAPVASARTLKFFC